MDSQYGILDQYLGLQGPDAAQRIEDWKAAWQLTKSKTTRGQGPKPAAGRFAAQLQAGPMNAEHQRYQELAQVASLEKSISGSTLGDISDVVTRAKTEMADLEKTWSFSNPSPLPLPYDLLPVIQTLVNRKTPLYDRIPTGQANGTAHHYFQITGYSNTGMGGVANLNSGISSDSVSNAFGPVNLRRGPQIGYATNQGSVIMTEHSLSDQVGFGVEFAMRPLGDAQQISHTAVTWASLLDAERCHLAGRGTTANGFTGAISAPTAVSVAVAAAGAGQTGNTANIADLYVFVCANSGRGDSVAGAATVSTALASTTGDVANVSFTGSAGALSYDIFAGTASTIANAYYCGSTGWAGTSAFTINFTGGGTGGCPNSGAQPPSADQSAQPYDYDGLLTVATGANSGYNKVLNAALGTTPPGEEIQAAFIALYGQGTTNRFADPDVVYTTASIRSKLSDLFKTSTSTNYRVVLQGSDGQVTIGGMVVGIENQASGRASVPIEVHPYMPPGNILIQSFHLPMPDSRIPNPVEFRLVQPFMMIDWTNIQLSYDVSTYWFGSLVHYAPQWSGAITGIND